MSPEPSIKVTARNAIPSVQATVQPVSEVSVTTTPIGVPIVVASSVGPPGPEGPPGGTMVTGWWEYHTSTSPPPASGQLRSTPNTAIVGDPYTLYISAEDRDGLNWAAGNVKPGDEIMLRGTSGNVQHHEVTAFTWTVPGTGGYATIQTVLTAATGVIAKNNDVRVDLLRATQQWIRMTQAQYDSLLVKDPNTLYVIVG